MRNPVDFWRHVGTGGRIARIRPVTLDRHRGELRVDGAPAALGARAFELLLLLVDAHGTVLSKDELMRRLWPDRVVEDNNLDRQISTLRKALGANRSLIRTVAGRGYQFTGAVRSMAKTAGGERVVMLPVPMSELIGRASEIRDILALATMHRLVTLTGVGGIGKTRLALEAARRLAPAFPDGVFFADLSPLSTAAVVPVNASARRSKPGGSCSRRLAGPSFWSVRDSCLR